MVKELVIMHSNRLTLNYNVKHLPNKKTTVADPESPWITAYRSRIATNSGSVSEADYASLDTFIKALVSLGLVTSDPANHSNTNSYIIDLCPFAGNNLISARCKLITPPGVSGLLSNNGFVEADYSRSTGMQGATNKSFNTNTSPNTHFIDNTQGCGGFYQRTNGTSSVSRSHFAVSAFRMDTSSSNLTRYTFTAYAFNAGEQVSTANGIPYTGLVIANRSPTSLAIWTQGVKRAENTSITSAGSRSNSGVLLMAQQPTSIGSPDSYGMFFLGARAIPEDKISGLTTAVNNLMTAFGRNV